MAAVKLKNVLHRRFYYSIVNGCLFFFALEYQCFLDQFKELSTGTKSKILCQHGLNQLQQHDKMNVFLRQLSRLSSLEYRCLPAY